MLIAANIVFGGIVIGLFLGRYSVSIGKISKRKTSSIIIIILRQWLVGEQ